MFSTAEFDNHEEVVTLSDPKTGLRAVIAIHSTVLGPGLGGVRCWDYRDPDEALRDALRLSRGMTYKNALAGLDMGGGKSVILGGAPAKTPQALYAFARAIERLEGRYIGAEDVGMTVADIDHMRDVTSFVAGTSWGASASGDPSPYTADGVFLALKAAVEARHGSGDLNGSRVGVLGLGSVGWKLAKKLHADGASLLVADIDPSRSYAAADQFGAQVFSPDRLPYAAMDIFAPCALGGSLTLEFAKTAPVKIICGAANNQLATPEVDEALWQAGKLYAPDYLVNAGGVMNVAAETTGEYDAYRVAKQVQAIGDTAKRCFAEAQRTDQPTGAVADALARARINGVRKAA